MPSKTTSRSVPDWDQAPQFGRRDTLLPALRRLHQLCEEPSCIVEIGSARDERPEACLGDGWSTRAWGWFALQTGGRAYTVDIEPEAIAACKRLTAEFAEAITYTTSDSLEFLRTWSLAERGTIDLLYLDSLDYIDTLRSEHRHLKEAAAALPSLSPRCLVLLDDTYPSGQLPSEGDADLTGKGALVAPFLLEQGFRLEWVAGGEALLSRGAEEIPPVIGLHGKTEAAITQRLQEHTHRKWRQMSALCRIGRDYRAFETTPEATEVLAMVARLCGKDGSACEVGAESAFGTVWLALQGIQATGLLGDPALLERARQASYWIGGEAQFLAGDPLVLYHEEAARYRVIHHRDLAAALPTPWLRSVLAQQVALADWVVFSVPSEFAPESDEMDALGCRLMPLEAWRHLLTPFEVADLRLYGASQPGGQDRIRVILKGQPLTPALRRLMSVGPEPYPFGISVIVHTRNEAHQLAECLRTVLSWADEIIICDMGSTDATLQIAHQFTDQIIQHTPIPNFDRSRNVSAMRARYRFLFYLDADERVPEGLGPRLRHLLATQGHLFEAMALPFKHHFAGKPMQSLAPYKAPSIYKNGTFFYNARPHQGARIEGRVVYFSADDPNNYLPHYSYTDISHYLKKMDHYTSTEAANLFHDGRTFHWQEMIVHAVRDMRAYYDGGGAFRDGPHGLLYSLLSGFYRIAQHGKLWESQYKAETQEGKKPGREESVVPQSLEEVLEFALAVARERPAQEPPAAASSTETLPAEVAWYGPHNSPSGYGEECRHFVLAADQAGVQIAARSLSWGDDQKLLEGAEAARLQELEGRDIKPGFVQIIQNFPQGFVRHPQAGRAIGRTMFETDRLPESWVQACNRMDAIWVPSEFNKETFRLAGVAAEKLVVVPGCFDPVPYLKKENLTTEVTEEHRGNTEKNKEREEGKFTFLSVFDWTRHKGWDVLLKAFVQAFEGRDDVQLVLKVWSSQGYTPQNIRDQAAELLRMEGHDLDADVRIRFVFERLTQRELIALYQACDAFVLPSRGEGWGRPYMEAMACGLPTIGTNWSGNTAFMTPENSYLLDYRLVPVPEIGWREIPTYQGHRWAEPDADHLRNTLRAVVDNREEGRRKGALARDEVCARFSREAVGKRMAEEILHHREHRGSQRKTTEKSIEHDPQINADYHRLQTTEENNQDGKKPENQEGNTGEASSLRPCSPLPLRERGGGVRVRWEGAQRVRHSLALVNRELCYALCQSGAVELSVVPTEPDEMGVEQDPRFAALYAREFAPLSGPAQVHVRHFFPPDFTPPLEGRMVLIQPWEYGYLPREWVAGIEAGVDEVWCYSNSVREVYKASGVPEEKLQVVPLGVNTEIFHPEAPPYVFTDEAGAHRWHAMAERSSPFVFLFVGGTIHRKGIDILLDAYLKAFSSLDDVVLVVKDTCVDTAYRYTHHRERLLALANDPTRPAVVYLDRNLPSHQHAGLYTAADYVVLPYRGEGFCLPALEAMSCGRPVMVTQGGPTDDFVDETVGERLEAERRYLPDNRIGEWECVDRPWMLEVSSDVLAHRMRAVVKDREEARRRGHAGAARVRAGWTWNHAAAKVIQRLQVLAQEPHHREHRGPQRKTENDPQIDTDYHRLQTSEENKQEPRKTENQERNWRERNQPSPLLPSPLKGEGRGGEGKISLCMIVKDEERVLSDCLKSAKPWFDEIIVVDTGSTDRTVEIAEEWGAQVCHFPWCDDFSAARNESLKYATGEWIFWLDADDTLPWESGEAIRRAVESAPEEIVGFVVPVQFVENGTPAAGTRVDHVKLFRNVPGLAFEGRIHEQILPSLRRGGGQVVRLNAVVLHSGYDTSPEGQARKRARDAKLLALDLAERPNHPFVRFNLGMTDHYGGEHEKAVEWLRKCLAVAAPSDSIVRKAYALLAVSQRELGQNEESLKTLEAGLGVTPEDPELHFHKAHMLSNLGRYAEARTHYEQVLRADIGDHFSSVDMGILGFKTYHNLGGVCLLTGDYPAARQWWLRAAEAAPQFLPSAFDLFNAALEAGDYPTAEQMLEVVQGVEGNSANLAKMQARYALARGEKGQAEATLRRAVALDGEASAPRWALARHLLEEDRVAEAKEHLVSLSGAGSAEAAFYLGVAAIRESDYAEALQWMERAQQLNPEHEETQNQIAGLRRVLEDSASEHPKRESDDGSPHKPRGRKRGLQ